MLLFGVIPTEPWDILLTPAFWWFVILITALIIAERIISWVARRTVTRLNLPRSAANNVMIGIRIIIIVIAITAALPLFGVFIPSELLVALTASLSTAIALFLSFSLQNVVAGFYILITRPFSVGDYVKIGGTEGIVEEITVNYTRIYGPDKVFVTLPNQRVLQNEIINYRVRERLYDIEKTRNTKKEKPYEQIELEAQEENHTKSRGLLSKRRIEKLEKSMKLKTLYRYTFDVTVTFDNFHPEKTEATFDKVCKKWKSVFGYEPSYTLWNVQHWLVYRFAITVESPATKLVENRNPFLHDIFQAINYPKI